MYYYYDVGRGGKRRNALGYLPSKLHLKVAAAVFHEFFSQ